MMSDVIATLDRITRGDSPFRYVTDFEHRDWTVRELSTDQPSVRDSKVLVFISDDDIRGIRSFPLDWRRLEDAELLSLSAAAQSSVLPESIATVEDVIGLFAAPDPGTRH
jgi:hypothetical protein